MANKQNTENEKISFDVVVKEKDVKAIQDVMREVELEFDISSQTIVKESSERIDPQLSVFIVTVGKELVKIIIEKYGESFTDWLFNKLGLNESEGEEVTISS